MTEDTNEYSSLTRDGKTIKIAIYKDGNGGWILEVVDEYRNSTVWDDSFPSKEAAMQFLNKTIEEEGIDSVIGMPPDSSSDAQIDLAMSSAGLSEDELEELEAFLMSEAVSDEAMMLDCLDGYLTAIVSGPNMIMPSQWLPFVWGPTADHAPEYESMEQAERIMSLMMRHMNSIITGLKEENFEPVFSTVISQDGSQEFVDGEMWAYGYFTGVELQKDSWKEFFKYPECVEVFRPIYLLGADDVTDEEEALTATPDQREELAEQLPGIAEWIYKFWLPYRHAVAERTVATSYQREHPKIGRNDPCPCGSGKKFKKCCGAPAMLH